MERFLTAFLACVLAAPAALTQTPEPRKPETARFGDPTSTARTLQGMFYGVIKHLDKKEMLLDKTKFGVEQTIKLDAKTKYIKDGSSSTLDNLKTGDQVWIQVKTEKKTGDMIAQKVYTGVVAPSLRK